MEDDLYQRDTFDWSRQQGDLLRRVARGERVNNIDWPNVIEEIEDVGRSQLRAVRSLLRQALVHLLKLHAWPESDARDHWAAEIVGFLVDAAESCTPSMRQNLDLDRLFAAASTQVRLDRVDGRPVADLPSVCPVSLDDLLADPPNVPALRDRFAEAGGVKAGNLQRQQEA